MFTRLSFCKTCGKSREEIGYDTIEKYVLTVSTKRITSEKCECDSEYKICKECSANQVKWCCYCTIPICDDCGNYREECWCSDDPDEFVACCDEYRKNCRCRERDSCSSDSCSSDSCSSDDTY